MAIPWAPIATVGSSLIAGGFSAFGQASANRAAAAEARRNREFQERMTRNRYQYTMEDMRRAGLNPILAYQQGGGPVPGGAQSTPQNVFSQLGESVSQGVSSALASTRLKEELKLIRAQVDNVKQDTVTKDATRMREYHNARRAAQETNILEQQEFSAKAEAAGARHFEKLYNDPKWGPILKAVEAFGRAFNPGSSAIRNLR